MSRRLHVDSLVRQSLVDLRTHHDKEPWGITKFKAYTDDRMIELFRDQNSKDRRDAWIARRDQLRSDVIWLAVKANSLIALEIASNLCKSWVRFESLSNHTFRPTTVTTSREWTDDECYVFSDNPTNEESLRWIRVFMGAPSFRFTDEKPGWSVSA